MNFGEVFSRAWQIIWRHKVLWIFGIMAGLAAGGDNGSGLRYEMDGESRFPWLNQMLNNIQPWVILSLILLIFVLILIVILLSTIGRASLMRGAWLADGGAERLTFSQLFDEGRRYFLRVLLLQLLLVGASLTLILILVLPTALTLGLALICLWPLFCLLIPVFFGLSVLSKLAIAGITGEDLGVIDSLRRAWELAQPNLLQVIVMAIALALGSFVIGAVLAIPMLAILTPLFIGIASGSSGFAANWLIISGVLFLLYLPILLAANGVLTAYIDTVWTVVFRRLSGRGPERGAEVF